MIIVASVAVVLFVAIVIADMRRLAAIRCVENAERLRLRFSRIRHELIMHAGSGEMEQYEQRLFHFLYRSTTMMLRHPAYYSLYSDVACAALLEPETSPPPTIRKKDLSKATRPILLEYVQTCDDVIEQFASRLTLFVAFLSGESVVDCFRNSGKRMRELRAEKERIERNRSLAAHALQMA